MNGDKVVSQVEKGVMAQWVASWANEWVMMARLVMAQGWGRCMKEGHRLSDQSMMNWLL